MKGFLKVSALIALAMAVPARSATVLFSTFDSMTSPLFATQGYANFVFADGWTSGDGFIEVQNNNVAGLPFSAPNLVELDTFRNSNMRVQLAAGRYRVSYWYSPRPNVPLSSNGIQLFTGNTLLDSVSGNGGGQTMWQNRSVNFTTTSSQALRFIATGTSDSLGGYLDNIHITAVPEPGVWAMLVMGFGLVGVGVRRRRGPTSVTA